MSRKIKGGTSLSYTLRVEQLQATILPSSFRPEETWGLNGIGKNGRAAKSGEIYVLHETVVRRYTEKRAQRGSVWRLCSSSPLNVYEAWSFKK